MRNKIRKTAADEALQVVRDHNAFVKNIATVNPAKELPLAHPENSWGFLLFQLRDPENFRPPCKMSLDGVERTRYFNPKTGEWRVRHVNPERGQQKPDAKFTKKTAVTLVPPSGRIKLYGTEHGIGILFDSNKCRIKDKYVFDKNIFSATRWWLSGVKGTLERSVTLNDIRMQQIKAEQENKILEWNEILPGLSADAVIGIIVPKDDVLRRLSAQYRRLILRNVLQIDVPILIMTPDTPVHEYTEEMQLKDLLDAEKYSIERIEYDFYQAIFRKLEGRFLDQVLPELKQNSPVDIFTAVKNRDINAIQLALIAFADNVKKRENNKTPIELAEDLGYWDCVAAIAKVVPRGERDRAGYDNTLLHATKNNESKAAWALIDAGAFCTLYYGSGEYTGYGAIHFAILHDDLVLLKAILETQGDAVNMQYMHYVSPLQLALNIDNGQAVSYLLAHGVPLIRTSLLNAAENEKWKGVFACLYSDNISDDEKRNIAHQLVYGASPQNNIENTAEDKKGVAGEQLWDAIAANNSLKDIKTLLAKTPALDIEKNKKTPMQLAADLGNWHCVILIALMFKTDEYDVARYGHALLIAAQTNQLTPVALALLNAGVHCNLCISSGEHAGYFAIHFAILNKNYVLLKAILEKYGRTAANMQHEKCITPLSLALDTNNAEAVSLLLAHGAGENDTIGSVKNAAEKANWDSVFACLDANKFSEHASRTIAGYALYYAVKYRDKPNIIEKLLTKNPRLDVIVDGKTPIQATVLHSTIHIGYVKLIATTIKTDENDSARYGDVLCTALANGLPEDMVLALVNAGASYTWHDCGTYRSVTHLAILYKNDVVLKAILEKHGALAANICRKDKIKGNGITPLSFALKEKKYGAVVLLLMHGATPNKNEWQGVFACLESSKISDNEKRNIAELLAREAFYQNDLSVIKKLAKYNPSSMQPNKTTDNVHFFKTEQVMLWRSQQVTAQLDLLKSDVENHLQVLESEILALSKKVEQQSHAFFSGITNYVKKNELVIKKQKKRRITTVDERQSALE